MIRVDSDWLRDINRRRILREIRRAGQMARVDLAEATRLSAATVTVVSTELIEQGLIEEAPLCPPAEGGTSRRRGRPRVMLRLNPKAMHLAGVKLAENRISVAVVDFCGNTVSEAERPAPMRSLTVAELVDLAEDVLRAATARAGLRPGRLSGIGLALPGYVDTAGGMVWWSPILSERGVAIADMIEARTGTPCYVDNDANVATLAELWFGVGQGIDSFAVVTVEHGVGMGLVLNGRLQRGTRGLGAELGHIKVALDGAPCRCGQRGCLEAYVADYALLSEARTALGMAPAVSLPDRREALGRLNRMAREGNVAAEAIIRRAAEMLGLGLANLINMLDPGLIILAGTRFRSDLMQHDVMERTLRANTIAVGPGPTAIRTHIWSDLLWTRGAAALALDAVFDDGLLRRPRQDQTAPAQEA